jgi:CysZ protein
MVQHPLTGARYVLRGLYLITRPGLRRFAALPLAINALLFGAVLAFAAYRFERLIQWAHDALPSWLHWLEWLLWPLFVLTALLLVFYTFTLVANLIGAPFNGFLAEAVEVHITGSKPEPHRGMLAQVPHTFWSELIKLGYMARWSLLLFILFFIPGINIAAPFLWLAFGAWMLAVQYLDYPMGNHGLSFSEQRRRLRRKPVLALSFGAGALLATMIPVVNFIAMPAAVAGATVLWLERLGPES